MKLDRPQASRSLMASRRGLWRLFLAALAVVSAATPALATAQLSVQVLGPGGPVRGGGTKVDVGVPVTIILTVTNGKVSQPIHLPAVDGLVLNGSGTNPGAHSQDFNFFVTPTRAGDYTIPAFDIRTDDGQILQVMPIKFHAVGS